MPERQIFEAAIEIADATKRETLLSQACKGQPELRAKVEALLQAHMNASSEFLARPAQYGALSDETLTVVRPGESGDDDDHIENEAEAVVLKFLSPSTKPGSLGQLAHYEILEFLGRGAFGSQRDEVSRLASGGV